MHGHSPIPTGDLPRRSPNAWAIRTSPQQPYSARSVTQVRLQRCSEQSTLSRRSIARGTVATVGFGGGRCTAVIINTEGSIPGAASLTPLLSAGRQVSYTGALRARGQLVAGGETIPMGVPPESAMFVRGAHEMLELLGARCVECGTINTPPSIHPTCISCGHSKFEEVGLARRGVIHTYVVNQTMPAPFVAPLPIAVIDLDDGARMMLQVTDDPSGVAIGATVELVLRRYASERGVPVYGFKARVIGS